MKNTLITLITILLLSCSGTAQKNDSNEVFPITKTNDEWKAQLNELEYYVLRKAGTERAFSSPLDKNYGQGIYLCAGCDTPLLKVITNLTLVQDGQALTEQSQIM